MEFVDLTIELYKDLPEGARGTVKRAMARKPYVDITHKFCLSCNRLLAFECFTKNSRGKCGLRSRCKECSVNSDRKHNSSEKAKERMKKYRETDRYKVTQRNYQHKRRANKLKTMDGSLPEKRIITEDLLALMDYQESKCVICAKDITIATAHLDHIVPLSKDGTHTLNNVQWLCPTCNCSKGNRIV